MKGEKIKSWIKEMGEKKRRASSCIKREYFFLSLVTIRREGGRESGRKRGRNANGRGER